MTVGIATAILAITEVLLPTGSDTYGTGTVKSRYISGFLCTEMLHFPTINELGMSESEEKL